MRRLATGVVAAALLLASAASADDGPIGANVEIHYGDLTPTTVAIVAGESVDWTNASVRNHTVSADDGAYDSGTLSPNLHFQHTYSDPGTYLYHCRLHPYIRGEVDVYRLLLDRPTAPASANHSYPLTGRSSLPAGTSLAIQFDDGSGDWQPAGDTSIDPDGHFTALVSPTTSGSYRVVGGGEGSPPVELLVLNSSVSARARSIRGGTRVSATVTPPAPGGTVVLQLHLKERFGWWPVAQRELGKNSSVTFSVPLNRRVSARVVYTLSDGATALATSETFKVAPLGHT